MNTNQLARTASLIGEPARTGMLVALLDGRALTAGELATVSSVTPATASRHLALMRDAGLVTVRQQGRHRYYRLASPDVARLLESMMHVAQARPGVRPVRTGPRDAALRFARTCYDHLAGRIAVGLCDHLVAEDAVRLSDEVAEVTGRAPAVLARLGITDEAQARHGAGARLACRTCLDWSERRTHLAGRLGALLCAHALGQGWLLRQPRVRTLELTPAGAHALRHALGHQRWNAITADAPAAEVRDCAA